MQHISLNGNSTAFLLAPARRSILTNMDLLQCPKMLMHFIDVGLHVQRHTFILGFAPVILILISLSVFTTAIGVVILIVAADVPLLAVDHIIMNSLGLATMVYRSLTACLLASSAVP